jgi:hypothetical protein
MTQNLESMKEKSGQFVYVKINIHMEKKAHKTYPNWKK